MGEGGERAGEQQSSPKTGSHRHLQLKIFKILFELDKVWFSHIILYSLRPGWMVTYALMTWTHKRLRPWGADFRFGGNSARRRPSVPERPVSANEVDDPRSNSLHW